MGSSARTWCSILAFAWILWGAEAQADVVGPPAEDCLNGARGQTCHGGPFCAPAVCADDSTCTNGARCQERRLCVNQFDCTSGYGTFYADQVVGACESGASCSQGECRTLRVCATGGSVVEDAAVGDDADRLEDGTPDGGTQVRTWGCGCQHVAPLHGGGVILFALLPAMSLLGWRWKRRRK